jgi:hypothetical protein
VKRMLLLELKNCLYRKEFKFIFALVMLLSVGGFLFACYRYYGQGYMMIRSAYDMCLIQLSTTDGILFAICVLLPLFSIILYSDSYFSDYQSGVYKSVLTRTSSKNYVWAKAFVISSVTFSTFFIPLLLNQLLCLITFPIRGMDNNWAYPPYDIGVQNYTSNFIFDLLRLQSPLLFNLLYMFLISLTAALIAFFAYAVYFMVSKGKFVVISGLFLMYVISNLLVDSWSSFESTLIHLIHPGSGSIHVLFVWLAGLFIPSLVIVTFKSLRHEIGVDKSS